VFAGIVCAYLAQKQMYADTIMC